MATELDQLRQEAESLKNQIRVIVLFLYLKLKTFFLLKIKNELNQPSRHDSFNFFSIQIRTPEKQHVTQRLHKQLKV